MLKVAICDDEPICAEKVRRYVENYFVGRKIRFQADTYTDATGLLQNAEKGYDILFLDVDMPDLDGIHLGRELRKKNRKAVIIYISALIQYAIDGYSVHAFQYLLKQDLEQTFSPCMDDVMQHFWSRGSFLIPTDAGGRKVPYEDILFFEVQNHTIIAHTRNQDRETWPFSGKILELETQLSSAGFLRVHKSYLANMRHIVQLETTGALLTDGNLLPCSRINFAKILQSYLLWEAME